MLAVKKTINHRSNEREKTD